MRHYPLPIAILLALIVGTGCNDHAAEPAAPPVTAPAAAAATTPTNPKPRNHLWARNSTCPMQSGKSN